MSLWNDFVGAEIRYIDTPTYGRIRVAEAGPKNAPVILFQHGIGGHLEAYSKNLVALSDEFHCVAFDYVGHAMSNRKVMEYTPPVLAEQVRELMDAMGIESAHLSGESLGGWVSGFFAVKYPQRVLKLMLNTGAGIPIVSEKGRADMLDLMERSKKAAGLAPTFEMVKHRIEWLIHPNNHARLVTDELVNLRLRYYLMPEGREVTPMVNRMLPRHDEFLVPLEAIKAETMLLWTRDNPIHDLECARAAQARIPNSTLYVMEADGAHWPQYEDPEEFNRVA
ncbi:alpha/beta hydrolase, partial [uncultured Nevskia sp.]|uniref:alpha/beta fold hydrolase n=1 Tax=uncultured Nevskia sp. TaxID=228950 RepID=UPI0025DDB0E1